MVSLTITRYPKWFGWAGVLSMAVFRVVLWFSNNTRFWKLMGSGRNGTFDKTPDWRQWAVLIVYKDDSLTTARHPAIFHAWWKFFRCETWLLELEPIEGHGTWDNKTCFGDLPKQTDYEGLIAVLTRATIRLNKLNRFWQHVDGVAHKMDGAEGFITSLGIGEVPLVKQATFSIWDSKSHMKQFAYQLKEHAEVIRKTRQENWYSEEMFTRFKIHRSTGSIRGKNPLEGKL